MVGVNSGAASGLMVGGDIGGDLEEEYEDDYDEEDEGEYGKNNSFLVIFVFPLFILYYHLP